MALRSYSVLDILLPTIIIIIQECSQALTICKCLWSLSCGGVPNMLLVLLITFHCHWYIWGCMCSTDPFQLRWLRRYIHSSCYYHHQIGSINLTHYHIFPWLCARDVCYIIFCHLLHIHSGKTGILFSLLLCSLWWVQIVGYVLACRSCSFVCTLQNLIIIIVHTYLKTMNLLNVCQIYFIECVSKIKHIFSVIHCPLCGAICFQFNHFPRDDWENIHFVLLPSSNRKYELLSIV